MKLQPTLVILALLFFQVTYGQWEDLESSINDDLTGVVFFENNGLVSGRNGLYTTTTYGIGDSSWKRFSISDNNINSSIYENTEFTHCTAKTTATGDSGVIYACGKNASNEKPVIFKIHLPSLEYEIIVIEEFQGSINKIAYDETEDKFYGVGDNGLYFSFYDNNYTIISTNFEDDFLSLDLYNGGISIGANNYVLMSLDPDTPNSFTQNNTPGAIHKDISDDGGYSYSVGNNYMRLSTGSVKYSNRFSYGALNGQAIIKHSGVHLIATDHGIFKSDTSYSYLEWQPSSSKHSINSFWESTNNSSLIYACGDNGTILKTENLGGATSPHVTLDVYGACVGNYVAIKSFSGSSKYCTFYVNGNYIKGGCTSYFSHRFEEIGEHEISIKGKNSEGEESTYTTTIHIVPKPDTEKAINVIDNILCKDQPLQIEIIDSEENVEYSLRKEGSYDYFGTSAVGDGSTIVLTSIPLETGEYYISASNTLANCSRRFNDSFLVTVEQTEAEFTPNLINAKLNETVTFSERTTDAANFEWSFPENSSIASSNLSAPQAKFSSLGSTEALLKTWSNDGCYDEITKEGPYIYQDLGHTEHSWSFINGGKDPKWNGSYTEDIGHMAPTENGFILCGHNNFSTLNSNIGKSHTFNEPGAYAAKYDRNGTLRWIVYTDIFRDEIHYSVQDNEGNVYITGNSRGYFIDSTGFKLDLDNGLSNFLIKLDSTGKIIWEIQGQYINFNKLFIDKDNNLLASGVFDYLRPNNIYLNGEIVADLDDTVNESPTQFSYSGHVFAKISPEGEIIWNNKMLISATNGSDIVHLGFDESNNIYLTGRFEHRAEFYSAGSNNYETLLGETGNYGGKLFLSKFTPNGQLLWKTRSLTYNVKNDGTTPSSMVTDADGNCYISGQNSVDGTFLDERDNYLHTFENTDGTLTQVNIGAFFVLKVNSNGVCQWIQGGKKSYYGNGLKIIKNGNELAVLGHIADRVENQVSTTFTGTNGNSIDLNLKKQDYFIAVYDTFGNLKRIIQNADNNPDQNGFDQTWGKPSFFKGYGQNYFISYNLGFYNYQDTIMKYYDFGNELSSLNGKEGVVTRFKESDGIIHFPSSLSSNRPVLEAKLKITPNPVKDYLNISGVSEISKIRIYNSLGQLIPIKSSMGKIKVAHLNTGIYIIKIEGSNKKTTTRKFIKL
ncbi:T9SS type A sorting domain-containing protein [Tamlana crocina]|uniref:T9SS type A sorting domain-containing protein n=1 Tax=Tamlana crocina TaxID=393006 RepID=A0ABX1DHQ0_9FLAO|nr:T9SS type A sorting domain-containing protein [Tamlana crocina]NJX16851.1 T9SS type A sorting domain-containing protein [Tamlana crocina]